MIFGIVWKKELDSKCIYNKKFWEIKKKSYGDEATDFRNKKIPKVGSNYTCLGVTLIVLLLKMMKTITQKLYLPMQSKLNSPFFKIEANILQIVILQIVITIYFV